MHEIGACDCPQAALSAGLPTTVVECEFVYRPGGPFARPRPA
jgi:hypothetical protein